MKNKVFTFSILLSFFLLNNLFPQQIIQNIISSVNSDSLLYFDKELSGVVQTTIEGLPYTIASRNKSQPGNDKAMTYIQQKLNLYGLTTSIQTFSSTGKNVLGVKTGTEFPNRKYIICAHFDDMPSGSLAPGADDNGSGTAAVIEAARIFKNYSFPFTIIFALWDEEEQGLVGSAYYANQAATAGDSILGVINLDMIAWDNNNDNKVEIHTGSLSGSMGIYNKMVELNAAYAIGLSLIQKTPGTTASDHASFWSKSIPAILLIEEGNDFNAYYHTTNDKLDYVNLGYMTKCAKLAYASLAYYALNLNMTIQHTPIASIETTLPIQTTATIQTGLKVATGTGSPKLYYRINTGGGFSQYYMVNGVPAKGNYTYSFTIPAQQIGTKIQYYIAAQDSASNLVVTLPAGGSGFNPPGSNPPPTVYQFFNASSTLLFADEGNDMSKWTVSSSWGISTAKYISAPSSLTDSPTGNYPASQTLTITSNDSFILDNFLGVSLSYGIQWDTEPDYDYAQVQISTNGGSTWAALQGQYTIPGSGSFQPPGEPLYNGSQLNWVNENIDLSSYIGKTIKLRFLLKTDNSIQKDGVYLDNIKLSTYSVVPVELVSFNASYDKSVKLLWQTATETNNKGFVIEKKSEQQDRYFEATFIKGAGTTVQNTFYSFEDKNVTTGKYFYRLRQVDFNGSSTTYLPVEVNVNTVSGFALMQNYPNPFNPSTQIKYNTPTAGFVNMKVYDVLGKEVAELVNKEQPAGEYSINFDAKNLPSGVYIYQLKFGGSVLAKQMLLVK